MWLKTKRRWLNCLKRNWLRILRKTINQFNRFVDNCNKFENIFLYRRWRFSFDHRFRNNLLWIISDVCVLFCLIVFKNQLWIECFDRKRSIQENLRYVIFSQWMFALQSRHSIISKLQIFWFWKVDWLLLWCVDIFCCCVCISTKK